MKLIINSLQVILLFLLVTAGTGCKTRFTLTNVCVVIYVEGTVYQLLEPDNDRKLLITGDQLPPSAVIVTEAGSVVELEYYDKSRLRIQENSVIRIEQYFTRTNIEQTDIKVDMGRVYAQLESRIDSSDYRVETDSIVVDVDGAEFVVTVDENKVSKIAVKKGNVTYSYKIDDKDLIAIKAIDPDFAERVKVILTRQITIEEDQQVAVDEEEQKIYRKNISLITSQLNRLIEKYSDDSAGLEEELQDVEDELIQSSDELLIASIEPVTIKEWRDDLGDEEFTRLSSDDSEEKKFVKINVPQIFIPVTIKLPDSPGIFLSENNSTITSGGGMIFITSNTNNSIYAVDPESGLIDWQFSDPYMNNLYAPAVYSRGYVAVGTPNIVFILDKKGKKVKQLMVTKGPNFWASPKSLGPTLYIPTSQSIIAWNGRELTILKEYNNIRGQVYLTIFSSTIYAVDINQRILQSFDLSTRTITASSEKFKGGVYMSPVISGGYLFLADINGTFYRYPLDKIESSPEMLSTDTGVMSNLVVFQNMIYYVGNNGSFYTLDAFSFNRPVKGAAVEKHPDPDKMVTKRLLLHNYELYFASDRGKLYIYTPARKKGEFIELDGSSGKPLVGSPVAVGDAVYVVDTDSSIYKRYYIEQKQ